MKFFRLSLLAFLLVTTCTLSAQTYHSSIGLRFGYPLSVAYKVFVTERDAVEGYVGYRGFGYSRAVSLNAAYLLHQDLESVDRLQWYYGGGAGLQFWNYDDYPGSTTLGVSGYLGLEYIVTDAPLSITLDWRPTLFIGTQRSPGFNSFGGFYGGIGMRYIID